MGILLKPSELCFPLWRLPHVYFLSIFHLHFFRGYIFFFSIFHVLVLTVYVNSTKQMCIFDQKCDTSDSNVNILQCKLSGNSIFWMCMLTCVRACVSLYLREQKHRTCVWKCVFLTSKKTDNGTLSRPMVQYPAHSPCSWPGGRICLSFGRLCNHCPPSLQLSSLHLK